MDTSDNVLRQLRKLREGVGLTPDRLEKSGAVMSALASSDPQLAHGRLLGFLDELGQGERPRALRVDLGLDLPELLGRRPVARELDWLGERRSGYAKVVGRSPKTLERWSDLALGELRAKLLTDQFNGHLIVIAAVEGDRIAMTTTIQRPIDKASGDMTSYSSTDYANQSSEPSLPALIYGYPRDWRPASISLLITFRDRPHPSRIEAVVARNFFELVYGVERHVLGTEDGVASVRFERPRTDRLYAIIWRLE